MSSETNLYHLFGALNLNSSDFKSFVCKLFFDRILFVKSFEKTTFDLLEFSSLDWLSER